MKRNFSNKAMAIIVKWSPLIFHINSAKIQKLASLIL